MLKFCITTLSRTPIKAFGLLLSVSLLVSCGGAEGDNAGLTRFDISGEITLDGEPVKAGEIHFLPADGRAKSQTAIKDGKYTASGEGSGHLGGKYQIQILGFDGEDNPANMNKGFPLWKGSYNAEEMDLDEGDMEGVNFNISRDEVGPAPEHNADPWEDT